mmetsp:Transcript_32254/g.57873  ORF Transcript_32254/g.57873 Transcript_32254/m.57873 type:complete len:80 (-) Transcript_32254:239-478(-)
MASVSMNIVANCRPRYCRKIQSWILRQRQGHHIRHNEADTGKKVDREMFSYINNLVFSQMFKDDWNIWYVCQKCDDTLY